MDSVVSEKVLTIDGREDGDRWFLLHCRPRQEKKLADTLSAAGVDHFLPLVRHSRSYGKRRIKVELPLFSGYLFLLGSLDQAYEADRTGRVAQIIQVADQQQVNWELTNLQLALSKAADFDPFPYLQKGVRVEVRSGPFRGLQGVVEDRLSGNRLILQVSALGQAISLELDGAIVDPLD